MSRYLLDTNQLIRIGERPDLLTKAAREAMSGAAALFVPVPAIWEIEIKRKLTRADGTPKLRLTAATAALVRYVVERGGVVLPLSQSHVLTALDPPCPNRDLFDRILLQQAQAEGLSLLTSDTKLKAHPAAVFVG